MKVIIAGGRDINDYELLKSVIGHAIKSGFVIDTVISGGARGVDKMGERWAAENGKLLQVFPADWNKFGKAAGPIRNIEMSKVADGLIAIRKDGSKGTAHMISVMEKLEKRVCVHWIGKGTFFNMVDIREYDPLKPL